MAPFSGLHLGLAGFENEPKISFSNVMGKL